MAKGKSQMSSAEKQASRARKEPRTAARKAARRVAQEQAASLNRVRRAGGEATPWQVACARRAAARTGVAGAA